MTTGARRRPRDTELMLSSCHPDRLLHRAAVSVNFLFGIQPSAPLPSGRNHHCLGAVDTSEWCDGNRCESSPQVLRLDDRAPAHLKPAKRQLRAPCMPQSHTKLMRFGCTPFAYIFPGHSATCSATAHVRSPNCHAALTFAIWVEACVTRAVHTFDSIVSSQARAFGAFPVLVTIVKRGNASCSCERNVGIPMFFFRAWPPQGILLQRLYDIRGISKRSPKARPCQPCVLFLANGLNNKH
ncbi:hypothetical protein BKA63DRAFT_269912 [Paraphoma chrysanthemicola]|nr:hypothetical protein BKA63DRAFT_269912 [Paraphoma chrysanthemicola]